MEKNKKKKQEKNNRITYNQNIVPQVRVFAMQSQFGTIGGVPDPNAQCFQGLRFKVINGVNVNYNVVNESLAYDNRFNYNGVSGSLYGAGNAGSSLSWGISSGSGNLRDVSYRCPAGVTASMLPQSFKVRKTSWFLKLF
jgi:hypothetical protein